jgi:O-antigen ligase
MRAKPLAATRLGAAAELSDHTRIGPNPDSRATVEPPVSLSPRAILTSLFSFEALLIFYMFAGIYKTDPRFAWLPANATGLFFALSVLVGSFIIVRNPIHRKSLPVVFAMICLVAWFWVGLAWSPSRIYASDKALQMTTLALWALIAGAVIIAPSPERLRRLFTVVLLLALWGGVDAVLAYVETGGTYRITTVEGEEMGGHLILGRIAAPGALVALAAWLHNRGRPTGWIYLGVFLALCFVLAIGGGRGALLSATLPLLIPIALSVRLTPRKIRVFRAMLSVMALLLLAAGALALYVTTTGQRLPTLDRLERLQQGNPRTELYARWAKFWPQAPYLGHGTGSWPVLVGRPDQQSYPHNLFLELLVENGIVGLILFLAVLAVGLRPVSLARMRRDPQALCAVMLFLGALTNAMTSGDLPGNRAVFMMLGVLALFAVRPLGTAARGNARPQLGPPRDFAVERRRAATELIR